MTVTGRPGGLGGADYGDGAMVIRVLALADIHGSQAAAARILAEARHEGELDVVLLAGDLTRFFTPHQLDRVLDDFAGAGAGVQLLAVAGNCDGPAVHEDLGRRGLSVGGRGRVVAGVGFCGVPSAPPRFGQTWENSEAQLAAWLEQGYAAIGGAATKVLLTHSPPADIPEGMPGSAAVARAVAELDFDLVVCGHIHEAHGVTRVVGRGGRITQVVNCGGAADGHYVLIQIVGREIRIDLR